MDSKDSIEKETEIFLENLLEDIEKIRSSVLEYKADMENFCSCFFNLHFCATQLEAYSEYFKDKADALIEIGRKMPKRDD